MERGLVLVCVVLVTACECAETTYDGSSSGGGHEVDGGPDASRDDAGSVDDKCLNIYGCSDGAVLCIECTCPGQVCGYTGPVDGVFDMTNIPGSKGEGVCLDDGTCAPVVTTPDWDPCPSVLCGEIGF